MVDSGKIFEVSTETHVLFLSQKCVFFGVMNRMKKTGTTAKALCFELLHAERERVAGPPVDMGWGPGVLGRREIKLAITSEELYRKVSC